MAIYTVTTLVDENDGGPGGAGLSLREALALANGAAGADTINFAPGLAGGTLFLTTDQQLSITTDGITIDGDINGDGTPDITIDADSGVGLNDAASRVFAIDGGATAISATLNGLTIRDGNAVGGGGGIFVGSYDALTLTNATVSGNSAGFAGGGIYGGFDAAITLTNVTVSGNSGSSGGGIFGGSQVTITLTNATVSGNNASNGGGGIYGIFDNPITLANSTVTGNSANRGGGIYNYGFGAGAVTTLTNSIVAGNAAATADDLLTNVNFAASLVFTGGNVIGSAPVNFASVTGAPTAQIDGTNQAALETVFANVAADPNTGVLSGVLADNGGRVPTVALETGGIAHNAGTNGVLPADAQDLDGDGNVAELLPVDARGLVRSVGTVDIGAFELQATPAALVVTTLDDEAFGGGDFLAETADGALSLREALGLANGDPDSNTITFDASLAGGTLFLSQGQELSITTDGITVDGDIDGDGTADITIDADSGVGVNDAASRVFFIDDGSISTISATLNGLVILDGNAGLTIGGGIFVGTADALTLTNATVSGNSAGNHGGGIYGDFDAAITLANATVSGNSADENGGGIYGHAGATITLTNATVFGNSAGEDGGGIYGDVSIPITLTNTTVSGNSAGGNGGGIYGANGNPITLVSSTVTGNSAGDAGGGIYNIGASGVTTLTNSIVAGNAATGSGDDLYGGFNSSADLVLTGGNIIGSAPANFATVTGVPTALIDGTSQTALETVFATVAADTNTGVLSGVLADNGGRVPTVAIRGGGIAHNAGVNGVLPADAQDLDGDANVAEPLPVDARGLARVFGGTVDIGAFEINNTAPVITSNGGGANATVAIPENQTAVTTVTATDLQNDVLAFSIIGGADAARFQIDAATGLLSFVTAPDFEALTDVGHNNGYVVQVRASDGALFDDQTLTVNVTDATGFQLAASGDLNGDGRGDLLWREEDGDLLVWYQNGTQNQAVSLGNLDPVWSIVGLGDFNGDGRDEIVRRHANGELVIDGVSRGILDNVWSIDAIGDFSGDGRDELVYRRVNGELLVDGVSRGVLDNVWSIDAVGDFNGDGRDELVYRHVNGELLVDGVSRGILDNVWGIEGAGDFNGDGRDELVYRRANGEVLVDGRSVGGVNNNRTIETIGDFDGNGRDELLWRHINGTVELNGSNIGNLQVL